MSGPYSLNTQTVNKLVSSSSPGVYILSTDGKTAHYVGRSDNDVAGRLNWWVNNSQKYTYFWFEPASSAKAAFDLECQWWHKYRPDDNQNHPDRPDGSGWQCPVCNIFNVGRRWY